MKCTEMHDLAGFIGTQLAPDSMQIDQLGIPRFDAGVTKRQQSSTCFTFFQLAPLTLSSGKIRFLRLFPTTVKMHAAHQLAPSALSREGIFSEFAAPLSSGKAFDPGVWADLIFSCGHLPRGALSAWGGGQVCQRRQVYGATRPRTMGASNGHCNRREWAMLRPV